MKEQPWNVEIEVLDNQMWCRAGQTMYEVVMASDKDVALEKVLKMHCLSRNNIVVIRIDIVQ